MCGIIWGNLAIEIALVLLAVKKHFSQVINIYFQNNFG